MHFIHPNGSVIHFILFIYFMLVKDLRKITIQHNLVNYLAHVGQYANA